MPEFILDHGDVAASRVFDGLDEFTQGYIEAMFFTNTGTGDDEENGLEHATFAELAPAPFARIVADCQLFQTANAADLELACSGDYDMAHAGRDYWYSSQGHGCGFWDGDIKDEALGERLTKAAGRREFYMYRGDDGLIYLD